MVVNNTVFWEMVVNELIYMDVYSYVHGGTLDGRCEPTLYNHILP